MSDRPYPGLRPFTRDETDIFFGREEQVDALLEQLIHSHFLAVVGPSGCGKSSLVRAGMIAALERGFLPSAGGRWIVAEMRPGDRPCERLAKTLLKQVVLAPHEHAQLQDSAVVQATERRLRRGPKSLLRLLADHPLPDRTNLLILVDQFEEIFRYREKIDANEADAFVSLLLTSALQSDLPIYVVITMRSEYLGDCALFDGLPEAINQSQFLTPRMSREQRGEAIARPAELFGGRVEPALLNQMLNETGADPDQLPLMQHVLMRMWTSKAPPPPEEQVEATSVSQEIPSLSMPSPVPITLTLQDYRQAGKLEKALSNHANEAFKELPAEQHRVAEILFRSLSERDIGQRGDTRRPVRIDAVAAVVAEAMALNPEEAVDQVKHVIEVFRRPDRSFLTPPHGVPLSPQRVVDISHESLIRQWDRMKEWVDREAESADTYRRLCEAAALEREHKEDLLGAVALQNVLDWKTRERPTPAWATRYDRHEGDFALAMDYLERSETKHRADKEAAERARRKEVLGAWQRRALVGFGLLFLISLSSAFWAWSERNQAMEARDEANTALGKLEKAQRALKGALSKLEDAKNNADKERNKAEQAAAEAKRQWNVAKKNATLSHIRELVAASRNSAGHDDPQQSLLLALHALSKIQKMNGGQDEQVQVIQSEAFEALSHSVNSSRDVIVLAGHRPGLWSVALRPDGAHFATGGSNGTLTIWDRISQSQVLARPLHLRSLNSLAYSPTGDLLATGGSDGAVKILDAESYRSKQTLDAGTKIWTVTFNPQGTRVAAAGKDGRVRIWETGTWQLTATLSGHTDVVYGLAFNHDGTRLATASADSTVKLWDPVTGKVLHSLEKHTKPVHSVAFSPDDTRLLTGSGDRTVLVWDLSTNTPILTLKGHTLAVESVGFSPDGTKIITTSSDRTAKIWQASTGKELLTLTGHAGWVLGQALTPDGAHLLTVSWDGSTKIWDMASGQSVATLSAGKSPVYRVAFSPDGSKVATASSDKSVKLWDRVTGQELERFSGHTGWVLDVTFHPDGKLLATGSVDATAKIWNIQSGRAVRTFPGHDLCVHSVAFSPEGKYLATGSLDGTARLWDIQSGQELLVFPPKDKRDRKRPSSGFCDLTENLASLNPPGIVSLAFHPKGHRLATGWSDGSVRMWDTDLKEIFIDAHSEPVMDLAFSPGGRYLATASRDLTAKIWDLKRDPPSPIAIITGHRNWVNSVAFSPDGTLVATAGGDLTAKLWDAFTGRPIGTLLGHREGVYGVAFDPTSNYLVTGSIDGTARIWATAPGPQNYTLRGHRDAVTGIVEGQKGEEIVSASLDGTVKIWDAQTGRVSHTYLINRTGINGVAMSSDGRMIATAGSDGIAKVLNAQTGEKIWETPREEQTGAETPEMSGGRKNYLQSVVFSPDSRWLATASEGGAAKLWDLDSRALLRTLPTEDAFLMTIAFSPDGTLIATGGADKTAVLWNAETGKEVRRFEGHRFNINALAFSPDGRILATASGDKTIRIWRTDTGEPLRTLRGQGGALLSVAFSPDGKSLVSSGMDNLAKVWDVSTGKLIRTLRGHTGWVKQAIFTPDGKAVLTAGYDMIVRVNPIDLRDLQTLAWSQIARSFTSEECHRFLRKDPCPESPMRLYAEGKALAKSGDVESAIERFQRAKVLDPTIRSDPKKEAGLIASHHLVLEGDLLYQQGRLDDAVIQLERAIALNPNHPRGLRLLGLAYRDLRQYGPALASLKKSAELDPQAKTFFALAQTHHWQGNLDEALDYLESAERLNPDYPDLYTVRADIYQLQGLIEKAGQALEKAPRTMGRESPYTLAVKGLIFYRQGEYEKAKDIFENMKPRDPITNDPNPYYQPARSQLGAIYYDHDKDFVRAYEVFEEVTRAMPWDHDQLANFAEANLATNRYQEAYDIANGLLTPAGTSPGTGNPKGPTQDIFAGSTETGKKGDVAEVPSTLELDRQLAMRFIIIASLVFQEKSQEALKEVENLLTDYQNQIESYTPAWSYAGTRHFITQSSLSPNPKQALLRLLDILETPTPDVGLQEFRNLLTTVQAAT